MKRDGERGVKGEEGQRRARGNLGKREEEKVAGTRGDGEEENHPQDCRSAFH